MAAMGMKCYSLHFLFLVSVYEGSPGRGTSPLPHFPTDSVREMTIESLNINTTEYFVKTTSHLANSAKVEKHVRAVEETCRVLLSMQSNTEVTNHIRW